MSTVVDSDDDSTPGDPFDLRVAGEVVDPAEIEGIATRVSAIPASATVTLDLSAVTFLSMEAVVPLVGLSLRYAVDGRPFRVVASASVRRKLEFLALDGVVPLVHSVVAND